jgi:glycosyltransferase involved in cell wall biosynthesis
MKIVFINISDIIGGAAIAAKRLGESLEKKYKTNNYFIVRTKSSSRNNVFPTRKNPLIFFIERWVNIILNLFGLQYIYLPFSPREILKQVKRLEPDIISLHNIIGGYFTVSLLIKLAEIAPIVWTQHDMWAITANATHTLGDESWKEMKKGKYEKKIFPTIGINTGNWLIKRKKEIYSKSDLTFIAPSNWLYKILTTSPLITGKKVFCIHNGIDLEIFKPHSKKEIRNSINIPEDSNVISFIAEKFKNSPFKGGEDLIKILDNLDINIDKEIHFIVIGKGIINKQSEYKNIIFHHMGYIKDEVRMSELLSASDLFIYPTKADTLPNVLIESIACGTPTITFDIGGCGDIIKNGISGYIFPPKHINQFCEKTIELLNDKDRLKEMAISSRQYAEKKFSVESMSDRYYELFEEILKASANKIFN